MMFARTAGKVLLVVILSSLPLASFSCTADQVSFNWVLLDGLYYWIGQSLVNYNTAECVCSAQQGNVHLAVFNATVPSEVSAYLGANHPGKSFWVDAQRYYGTYYWPNNCPVPMDSDLWGDTEPALVDTHLQIMGVNGDPTLFYGFLDIIPSRPLCQSATPPPSYTDVPLTMEWVTLGSASQTFGFSYERKTVPEARHACDYQPGEVSLAALDQTFFEVKQYVWDNYRSRHYWVDATSSGDGNYVWSNGVAVDSSVWADGEPDDDDVVARLDNKQNDIRLDGKNNPDNDEYYVCEGVPETSGAHIEWTTLGGQLYGFSMTPSQGFDWAKQACDKEAGYVWLASLETGYNDVRQYVQDNYPSREFWVDATRDVSSGETSFHWRDGSAVDDALWAPFEPGDGSSTHARLDRRQGNIQLAATSSKNSPYYFVCEGTPAAVDLTERVYDDCPDITTPAQTTEVTTVPTTELPTTAADDSTLATESATSQPVPTTDAPTSQPVPSTDAPTSQPVSTTDVVTTPSVTSQASEPTTSVSTELSTAPGPIIECLCSCSPNNRPQNVSLELLLEAVQREIKKTQEDLLLDTSNLSATIRRKTSAKDSRPAAQATGAIGIVMLVVVFGSIILPDIVSLVHAVVKAIRNFIRDKGNKPQ